MTILEFCKGLIKADTGANGGNIHLTIAYGPNVIEGVLDELNTNNSTMKLLEKEVKCWRIMTYSERSHIYDFVFVV